MIKKIKPTLLMLLALIITNLFVANNVLAQTPDELIEKSVQSFSALIDENRSSFADQPEPLFDDMAVLLSGFFDFDGFARGVMGKSYAAASNVQKSEFSAALKQSLVESLTEGLVGIGEYSIELAPTQIKEGKAGKPRRAKANIKIDTAAGVTHKLSFSLTELSEGNWRVRNVVFDGVNLGLTFRSQFADLVKTQGELQLAIVHWEIKN